MFETILNQYIYFYFHHTLLFWMILVEAFPLIFMIRKALALLAEKTIDGCVDNKSRENNVASLLYFFKDLGPNTASFSIVTLMRIVSNPKSPETINYNHLKLIKRLEKRYGYELVQTSISGSLDMVQWAIKQGDEEYHFEITDVITYDIDGTQTLKEFIVEVLGALEKRKLERLSQAELFEKASRVFVGIDDSIGSGNCQYGTTQFIVKHHIDTSKIGGIRGDVLLQMESSNFTKRAVNHAIITHGGLAS